MIDFQQFKCRSSSIVKVLANSSQNPILTDKQTARLKELRDKEQTNGGLPLRQAAEMAELLVKEGNGKKIVLSTTCIEYLMEVYAWETEQMIPVNKESLDNLTIRKGKMAEELGGLVLSVHDGVMYQVHKERIENDFITGEVDLFLGEHIYAATNISDIKNSFDYPTFLKKLHTGLEYGQKEQLQGYGDITGAQDLCVVNCLVNAPGDIIEEMKWKVLRKINAATFESQEFLAEWPRFERSMKFDHMPIELRVSKIKVEPFTDFERQRLYDRVKVCRDWLCNFHEQYTKLS